MISFWRRRLSRAALLAVALPWLVCLAVVLSGYDHEHYIRGDALFYLVTARSLLTDHDLAIGDDLKPPLEHWSGHVAIDRHGRIVPKHPPLLAFAALPLIAPFGPPGALVFNLLQIAVALALAYAVAVRVARPAAASLAVVLTGTTSFLPHYAWNFSPDVFASVLLLAGVVALSGAEPPGRSRAVIGGGLFGLACAAKLAVAPALLLAPALVRRPLRMLPWFALGLAIPLAGQGALNWHLFGSPVVTGYNRIAEIEGDRITARSESEDFDLPWADGLRGQLLDRRHGLLFTSPVTLLSLACLPLLAGVSRRLAVYVGGSTAGLVAFLACYRLWTASHWGNRYLMPVVLLAAAPLAVGIDRLWALLAARRAHRRPATDAARETIDDRDR